VDNDPIISVYINRERRFVFLEFKTMEITTACLALDGIDVMGQGKVKVKRPNDYNAALAPMINPTTAPQLDTSKLGIVSPTVPDGPNKIFIGGLPYHLTESQVLELLSAFGAVKAFHLVKQDANATTSKGYCFVEYADPNITQVACMGLQGMEMGGGKQLSCRMAAQQFAQQQGAVEQVGGAFGAPVPAPPVQASVVDGVDVDALLAAALGGGGVSGSGAMPIVNPTASLGPMGNMMVQHQQPLGVMPSQQMGMYPMGMMPQQQLYPQSQGLLVSDPLAVANAAASALDAAFGGGGAMAPLSVSSPAMVSVVQPSLASTPTRILVLLNMVMDEDLLTEEDHKILEEEVREEVSRYGKLVSMKIPRPQVR
jgi:splicing factor U2AF subunit